MILRTEPTTSKSSAREDEAVRLHPPDIFATDGHEGITNPSLLEMVSAYSGCRWYR
jgi:hypothetical protein